MSSEDVIELESSDEEREPATKKRKPMPNAMVCIPRIFPGITVKPVKSNSTCLPNLSQGIASPSSKLLYNIARNSNKFNGKAPVTLFKPKVSYNPYSDQQRLKQIVIQNKPCSSEVTFTKIDPRKHSLPKSQSKGSQPQQNKQLVKIPVQIKNIGLPPSITVRKTVNNNPKAILDKQIKQDVKKRNAIVSENVTVNLDDDESPQQNSHSLQWYIRPEDQKQILNPEEENNKEPSKRNLVEIVIEDSPVKPLQNKRTNEVGSELAIVIDDSPVKVVVDKNFVSGSENEDDKTNNIVMQSKKKLEYPKEADTNKTIEIEIDLSGTSVSNDQKMEEKLGGIDNTYSNQTKVNEKSKDKIVDCQNEPIKENKTVLQNSDQAEFHPIYQSFIDLCFKLENTEDMKKIVENKIKKYYRQVPKEYTESEDFTDMVSTKILSMKASPERMYLFIKDIVDELKLQRNLAKVQPAVETPKTDESSQLYEEESQYSSKRQRQIRKLEKTIKKLHRAIQKLEEQEVDFDDEDDSVYILTDRYKERMVRVYAKFCQLTNTKMPSEPRIQIEARLGRPSGPAKRLEKWVNKKVPIGTPLPFPDFHDVLNCVREANEEDRLGFNEADIMEEARDLFIRCGKKLQRRRQENEWRLAASRITAENDPAEKNIELQKKLTENKIIAQKEDEIFNKFADRQNQLKLEGEEIGDKEAEESPVESEEEEQTNDVTSISLENTEKRKERLKRLIQEQSRKSCEEKETYTSNEDQNIEATNIIINEEIAMEKDIAAQKGTVLETNSEMVTVPDPVTILETAGVPKVIILPETVTVSETVAEIVTVTETVTVTEAAVKGNAENNINNETDIKSVPAMKTDISTGAETEDIVSEKKNIEDGNDSLEKSNNKQISQNVPETCTLSESELESDMDELHLLQKLHTSHEGHSSTVDSSDSESPIAISDTLESSENDRKEDNEDVISIEDSSYSEDDRDTNIDFIPRQDDKKLPSVDIKVTDKSRDVEVVQAPVHTTNDEYTGPVEDILLASTEEENSQDEPITGECFNLRDDLISIDETVVGVTKAINNPVEDKRITVLDK